jgi:hypothetical protein
MPLRRTIGLLLLACCIAGCSSEPEGPSRFPVAGYVTFDGVPVETGTIIFRNEDRNAQVAPDGGNIVKGQYHVQVQPGEKRVEIMASRPIPGEEEKIRPDRKAFATVPVEQYIPAVYNAQSVLTATVEQKKNKFDFDLEAARTKK